jgi:hypothetical protein
MEIPKKIKDEIWDYCRANSITNIDDFTVKLLKQGFTIEKFGATPTVGEVIKEKIVEKIIEVEKIVEVPVTIVDTELSNELKKYIELHKLCKEELDRIVAENIMISKELEKTKKKKDIYGEQ